MSRKDFKMERGERWGENGLGESGEWGSMELR
jgi:hypothetical protein